MHRRPTASAPQTLTAQTPKSRKALNDKGPQLNDNELKSLATLHEPWQCTRAGGSRQNATWRRGLGFTAHNVRVRGSGVEGVRGRKGVQGSKTYVVLGKVWGLSLPSLKPVKPYNNLDPIGLGLAL